MVKRTGGTTVAEARRSPDDIAAAVAEEQQRQRRESIQADVEAWRKLVYSVADGAEPTGEQLWSIGELSARLRAPADSIAEGVTAVERDRAFDRQLVEASARLRDLKAREPQLRADLEDARQNCGRSKPRPPTFTVSP